MNTPITDACKINSENQPPDCDYFVNSDWMAELELHTERLAQILRGLGRNDLELQAYDKWKTECEEAIPTPESKLLEHHNL